MVTAPQLDADLARAQFAIQLEQLMRLAEAAGVSLRDKFAAPPNAAYVEQVAPQIIQDTSKFAIKPYKPGEIDLEDKVTFTPELVPSLGWPIPDEEGNTKLLIVSNDRTCWLTVGYPATVNRVFYETYKDCLLVHKELQNLKKNGPDNAPWGKVTSDGRKTWHSVFGAPSFGLTDDGHWWGTGQGQANPFAPAESPTE